MQQAVSRTRTSAASGPKEVQVQKAVAAARARKQRQLKLVPAIMFSCMVMAVLSVLLVPVLVGGAAPAASAAQASDIPVAQTSQDVTTVKEAELVLGFVPVLPNALPEGYEPTAYRVLDGHIFEAEYSNGKNPVVYRTALGNEDLSGDTTEYAFTQTETVDGVARGYAGVAEKKLNLAVWAHGDSSYAVLVGEGMETESFKLLTESVG